MTYPLYLLAVMVACSLVLGCSGDGAEDGEGATSTTATGAAAPGGACGLLSTAEVSDLFGEAASAVPGATDATCLWEGTGGDPAAPTRHQLQLSLYPADQPLDPAAYGDEAETVDGLGDEAFVVPDGPLGATAGYTVDDRSVVLTYAIVAGAGDDAPPPADRADELVDLLRTTATPAS